jgi:hypothetical protein
LQDFRTTVSLLFLAESAKIPVVDIKTSYLKAGLVAGMKAEAEAKQAAMQKAVFIVTLN